MKIRSEKPRKKEVVEGTEVSRFYIKRFFRILI